MKTTRREWLAAAGGLLAAADLDAMGGLFHATSINHLSLTVPDVKSAGAFYYRVLGMRVIRDMGERGQMRGLKRNYLALFQGEEPGLNHFSPGVDGLDEAGAGAILKQHGYEPFERAPNIWACLDPDGNQNHLSETMRREDQVAEAYGKDPKPDSILHAVDVNHVALEVSDVGRSVEWYQALMGLNVVRRGPASAFLGLGGNFLALFQREVGGGADHFCFSVEDYEPEAVGAKLAKHGIESTRREDRIYFKDLNGLTVQVSDERHQP
jgi:catechol 2,3-dioxygenase-like lactoylglutathione lyase family enzyme